MSAWERLLGPLAQRFLMARAAPGAIRRQLAAKPYPSAPPPDGRQVRLGVVQLEGQLHRQIGDYVEHVASLTRRAVENGAQLVIFPEDTGSYPLAGLIPGIERLASGKGKPPSEAVRGWEAPVLLLFRLLAPAASRAHGLTFSALARLTDAHILAGSTVVLDDAARVYKEARLYGPDGALLMAQRKTHLFPAEALWGLSYGDVIHVAQTSVGTIAAPICMDHTYFEPIRAAWLRGAEIIIDPAADAARYEFWAQRRGVWGRVQESPAYGVHALMVGHILGNEFGGRSGVYAPLALTPQGDGVLAEARTGDMEEVFCVTLDLEVLRAFRREHAPDFNLELYRQYTPAVYAQAHERRSRGRRMVA
jgi:predicted amidohydrolase